MLPALLRNVIDHGFGPAALERLSHYFMPLLLAAAAWGMATGFRFYYVTWLGERVIADIRKAVFDHVIGLTPAFFEVTRTGEVLSRLTADTTLIQTVVGSSISVALRNFLMFVGGLTLMFVTSLKLSAIVVAVVLLVMIPLMLFGRWVRTLSRRSQDRIADTSARASETLNAVQTVQAFTHENLDRKIFGRAVELSFDVAVLRTKARAVMTAAAMFGGFASVVGVLWIGARDVNMHVITGGQLLQFLFYAGIVAGGVGALSETWGDVQRAAGASERLMELLLTQPAVRRRPIPQHLPAQAAGAVIFRDVSFRYPTRPDAAALNDFSLAVTPGEAIALVGPSGAGKSTVFQLLLRFFAAQEGQILFDGVDTAMLDPTELRKHIALVAQDPAIFSGTIADNIRYGRPEASDEEVRRAAEARGRGRIHRAPAGRLRKPRRRTRHDAVGRPAPAHRHRARHAARCAAPAARRSDQRARCRERAIGADGPRQPDGRPHDHRHRAPPRHDPEAQTHRGDGSGPRRRRRQPRRTRRQRRSVRTPRRTPIRQRHGAGGVDGRAGRWPSPLPLRERDAGRGLDTVSVRVRGTLAVMRDASLLNHAFARHLRRRQTDFERKLWYALRNRQLAKFKFRRQQPIGPYIADFFCSEVGLIIELDGSQHGEPENRRRDEKRTEFLELRGYKVLRFWNHDLIENMEGVLDRIFLAVSEGG